VRHFGLGHVQFLFREIFVRNEYAFQAAGDRPVIFDCGANIGMATLFFKWLYPGCEIHAFEPHPETFAVLSENVTRNQLAHVALHNVALVAKPGRFDLFTPGAGSGLTSTLSGRSTSSSVRRLSAEGEQLSTYASAKEIDFLKMDVEGAEEPVLRELASTGRLRNIKELAVEYHHNLEGGVGGCGSFLQLLDDSGYQYQLDVTWGNPESAGTFQDILIRACRSAQVVVPAPGNADRARAAV
jgi:FkbM family methyltransferase